MAATVRPTIVPRISLTIQHPFIKGRSRSTLSINTFLGNIIPAFCRMPILRQPSRVINLAYMGTCLVALPCKAPIQYISVRMPRISLHISASRSGSSYHIFRAVAGGPAHDGMRDLASRANTGPTSTMQTKHINIPARICSPSSDTVHAGDMGRYRARDSA